MSDELARLKTENEALRRKLILIHELATWDGEDFDAVEPTEDDMIEALVEIYGLSYV